MTTTSTTTATATATQQTHKEPRDVTQKKYYKISMYFSLTHTRAHTQFKQRANRIRASERAFAQMNE